MTEKHSDILTGLVVGRKRDGRCIYSEEAKRALVEACLEPGASVAGIALSHGINANLLRKWLSTYRGDCVSTGRGSGQASKVAALLPVTAAYQEVAKATPTGRGEGCWPGACIEIVLSAATVRLHAAVDVRYLREVMDCLARRA